MSKYSVEEVRARFEAWVQKTAGWKACKARNKPMHLRQNADGSYNDFRVNDRWCAYKSAFAERIETDERAMPDVVAIMSHLPDNRAATRAEIFRALRLTEQTSSPAQTSDEIKEWEEFGRQIEKRLRYNSWDFKGSYPEIIDQLIAHTKEMERRDHPPAQAAQVDVGKVREVIAQLREYIEASDDSGFGTLSTSLIRDYPDKLEAALSEPKP